MGLWILWGDFPTAWKGGVKLARKVKCQITGEYGTSETFYKADNGKYYKSKELYNVWNKENEDRKRVIERFTTVHGLWCV